MTSKTAATLSSAITFMVAFGLFHATKPPAPKLPDNSSVNQYFFTTGVQLGYSIKHYGGNEKDVEFLRQAFIRGDKTTLIGWFQQRGVTITVQ